MKALFMSGGATKFVSIVAAARTLQEDFDYKPDVIAGVSSGSISGLIMACNLLDVGIEIGKELTLDTIFDKCPFNDKGNITLGAIVRLLRGKNYIGKMGNLEKLIKAVVTRDIFEAYQNDDKSPEVAVMAVNATSRARQIWWLKRLDYNKAIKAVMASSSIPGMAPPVEIDGQYYYDGGLRDHSPGNYILDKTDYGGWIKEAVTIFSRPEDYKTPASTSWKKNVATVFMDLVFPVMNMEISKNDEFVENTISIARGIRYRPIFIDPFANSLFDVNSERMEQGYQNGVKAVGKYYGYTNQND